MARGKTYSHETKLEVFRLVESGKSIADAARALSVPYQTAQEWVYSPEFGEFRRMQQTLRLSNIENLTLRCLEKQLETLLTYGEETSKPEFIRKQNASDMAVLYGAIADRTFALLNALAQSQRQARGKEDDVPRLPS